MLHDSALKLVVPIHKILFSGAEKFEMNGISFRIKDYAGGVCKGVVLGNYLYITQNPNKSSKFAKAARVGHKISWLIYHPTNEYLARVEDGNLIKL